MHKPHLQIFICLLAVLSSVVLVQAAGSVLPHNDPLQQPDAMCLLQYYQYFSAVVAPGIGIVMVGFCGSGEGSQLVYVNADMTGTSWTSNTNWVLPNVWSLVSVAYASSPPTLVAVGGVAAIITSTDGTHWVEQNSTVQHYFFNTVSNINGIWLAGTSFGNLLYSFDTVTWNKLPGVQAVMKQEIEAVTFGNGTFIVAGGQYDGTGPFAYTSDTTLTNWTVPSVLPPGSLYMHDVTYSPKADVFVSVGTQGESTESYAICYSATGAEWTFASSVAGLELPTDTSSKLHAVVFVPWLNGGVFVAVGSFIATSANGVHWTAVPASKYPSPLDGEIHYLNDILATDKFLLVMGTDNKVWKSVDGMNWKQTGPTK